MLLSRPVVGEDTFDRLFRSGEQLRSLFPPVLPLVKVRERMIRIQVVRVVVDQLLICAARALVILNVPLRLTQPFSLMGGSRPAHDDTNAYYAAEVQSVLRPEIRSHVLCKPARNNNPPTLNFWPRTRRFERDAISLAFFVG